VVRRRAVLRASAAERPQVTSPEPIQLAELSSEPRRRARRISVGWRQPLRGANARLISFAASGGAAGWSPSTRPNVSEKARRAAIVQEADQLRR
jgi:hypothetical protein